MQTWYRGVCKHGKKYQAATTFGGKNTHIGTHETAKEAAIAYDRAVLKANKSTSLLNLPDETVIDLPLPTRFPFTYEPLVLRSSIWTT